MVINGTDRPRSNELNAFQDMRDGEFFPLHACLPLLSEDALSRAAPLLFLDVVRTLAATTDSAGGCREIDDAGKSIARRRKVAVAVGHGNTAPHTVLLRKRREKSMHHLQG